MSGFVDAIESFFDQLTSIAPLPLALAILCPRPDRRSVSRLAQHRRCCLPRLDGPLARHLQRVRGRHRGERTAARARGDLLRLYIARHRIEGSSYPTLASSLLAETIFDSAVGVLLLTWALSAGVLPGRACSLTWRASTGSGSSTTLVVRPGSSSWSSSSRRSSRSPASGRSRTSGQGCARDSPSFANPVAICGRGMAGA